MKRKAISLLLTPLIISSTISLNTNYVFATENKASIETKENLEVANPLLNYDLNKVFNGSTDYVDVNEDLVQVKDLNQGAISVKFKANNSNQWQTLLSMTDKNDSNSGLFLGLTENGFLRYEVRENGQLKLGFEWKNRIYDDGEMHGIVLNIGGDNKAELYIDGVKLYSTDYAQIFFDGVITPNNLNIGRYLGSDNSNGKWYLDGEVSNLQIYDVGLSQSQCLELSEIKEDPKPEPEGEREKLIAMLKGEKDLNVIFTGDSITHGPLHTKGYRSYSEHFSERLKGESINDVMKEDSLVVNTGVSSATTRNILNGFNTWVNLYNPDVVFIMIGMNDSSNQMVPLAEYERNISKIVDRVRDAGAIPVLQTSNTIKMASNRVTLPQYIDTVRKVSSDKNVTLIDHYAHWEQLESENPNIKNEFLNDSIHPNEKGHLEMAKLILRELEVFEEDSYTCNLAYPITIENDLGRSVNTTYYPRYEGVQDKTPLVNYNLDRNFNGDYVDKSEDLSKVSNLSNGTIVSRFKVENNRNAQTILSISDSKDESSNMTLAINGGSIHFSVRDNNGFSTNITTTKGGYNDGLWHTVAVDVSESGTNIYIDGEMIHSESNKGFFNSISEADALNIGRNLDNKASGEWFYYGDLSYVDIYDNNLSEEELLDLTRENINDNLDEMKNIVNENSDGAWVFLGDDDTTGKGDTYGYKNYVEYIEERVRWELNGGSMIKREKFMINSAIESADSTYILNNFDNLAGKYNPKATFIMIGGNETVSVEEFKNNLSGIVDKAISKGSVPVLQTPVDNGNNIDEYVNAIREVSSEKGVLLIDHHDYWERLSENQSWLQESWLLEGNPNHRGHLEMAKKVLKDLRIYHYNSLTCRFTIDTPGDEIFEEVKNNLNALVENCANEIKGAVEGYNDGEYITGAKAILQNSIDNALLALEKESLTEMHSAVLKLEEAKNIFDSLLITELTGDLSKDGKLNIGDLSLVSINYGKDSSFEGWSNISEYDLNKDEVIDDFEVNFISQRLLNR